MKQILSVFLLLFVVIYNTEAQEDNFAKDEIIVKIKEIIPYQYQKGKTRLGITAIDQINEQLEVSTIEKLIQSKPKKQMSNRPNTDKILVIKFSKSVDIGQLVQDYVATEIFEYVEPNFIGHSGGVQGYTPNDPNYSSQWQFKNDGTFNSSATAGADMNMETAWDITTGDSSVVVAILDSGMKLNHPEISNRLWGNSMDSNGNGIDDDQNGFIDDARGWDFAYSDNMPVDDHGHGTNVGSIVGMEGDNGIGLSGVDWNCKLMIAKILKDDNSGFYSWWTAAIYYAVDNGADVINMSVGGSSFSATMKSAVDYAHANDVVVIACMMNNDNNVPNYPAAYANTIAVGATGVDDSRVSPFFWSNTSGSSFGNHIDLSAPGSPIYGLSYNSNANFNSYWGGTSQAAPQVTGVVALIKALDPLLGVEAIRDILKNTSDDQVGDPNEDVAGWDQYHGAGRLNAGAALTYVQSLISSNDKVQSDIEVIVAPNPTSDIIEVDAKSELMHNISIYNMNGQLMKEFKDVGYKKVINLEDLAVGVYIIELKIGNGRVSKKIIKK
ncbi:MAG: S8 family serine peptidase [Saprospiraceae bacterium]